MQSCQEKSVSTYLYFVLVFLVFQLHSSLNLLYSKRRVDFCFTNDLLDKTIYVHRLHHNLPPACWKTTFLSHNKKKCDPSMETSKEQPAVGSVGSDATLTVMHSRVFISWLNFTLNKDVFKTARKPVLLTAFLSGLVKFALHIYSSWEDDRVQGQHLDVFSNKTALIRFI